MTSFREGVLEPFQADVEAWHRVGWQSASSGGTTNAMRLLVHFTGLRATFIHRLAHWAHNAGVPLLPALLSQVNVALHGIEMPPALRIGPGLYMPHTVGTVINADRIGANVTIQGGVTVGLRVKPEFPVIEDGVTLAAGCRVLGPLRIGRGATIGANAVVVDDVAEDAVMVGIPARALVRS